MWTEIIVIGSVVGVLTVIGTVAWWKLADRWVDEEHKRFKTRPERHASDAVVVRLDRDEKP